MEMRPPCISQVDPNFGDRCPYERGHRDTDTRERKPCDHAGRDGSDAATSQGCQQHQEPAEAGRTVPWSRQTALGLPHLISDFWPLVGEAASVCPSAPATTGHLCHLWGCLSQETHYYGHRNGRSEGEGRTQGETAGVHYPPPLRWPRDLSFSGNRQKTSSPPEVSASEPRRGPQHRPSR